MSRERCLSLDRNQRAQQQNVFRNNGYLPGRSPNRSPLRSRSPHHVLSTPEIFRQNNEGAIPSYAMDDYRLCEQEQFNRPHKYVFEKNSALGAEEHQRDNYTVRLPQIRNLPDELLEEFDEPSYYEINSNASFEDLVCTMATPPPPPNLAVNIDDVRKRITDQIGLAGPDEGTSDVVTDDVRKHMNDMIAVRVPEPCPYKGLPLPKDSRVIPPHPKDPNDVAGMIRRARAIARKKAIEEAEAAKAHKEAVKRGVLPSKKPPPKKPTAKPVAKVSAAFASSGVGPPGKDGSTRTFGAGPKNKQRCLPSAPHPPDYLAPEWAAAILRTRKLAGLKTKNPKILQIPKTPSPSPPPQIHSPSPFTTHPPTYKNIMDRVAALRKRDKEVQAAIIAQQTPKATSHPITDEGLDEFEALEQLYGAVPDQCILDKVSNTDIQDRMAALEQQLFQYPTPAKPSPSARPPPPSSPAFEMPPILRYYDLLKHRETMAAAAAQESLASSPSPECPVPEYEKNLQRIQGIADWGLSDLSELSSVEIPENPAPAAEICPSAMYPSISAEGQVGTPFRSQATTPISRSPATSPSPDFVFSEEAFGLMIDENVSLGEISMPEFDEDILIDEYGLEDVTSPELCDLSISCSGMAFEADYPLELTNEEEAEDEDAQFVDENAPKPQGFLTSMVSSVFDRFKNMFTLTQSSKDEEYEQDDVNLFDTSLPILFETTPPPKQESTPAKEPLTRRKADEVTNPATFDEAIIVPPHPKDPKDYTAIVKRAQAIQKKKAKEAADAAAAVYALPPPGKEIKGKPEVKSTIPKRAPPPNKKGATAYKEKKGKPPAKVYLPGEFSPRYAAAVARARSLAGFKNRSALLNPERAARMAERIAKKEAELAAIEALPPVERMRAKMKRMEKRTTGDPCPRPSIESLGALEAIRSGLPMPDIPKRKWKPAARLKADRRVKRKDRVFTQDFGRILIPAADIMSPLQEEPDIPEVDFMQFSPLKPHESQLRLQYLKEDTARRALETIRAAEEAQAAISTESTQHRGPRNPVVSPRAPQMTPVQYSPIRLQSPSSSRSEQTRRERITTQIGGNGGQETIKENVLEMSTTENGEVHTSTKQVTTKTDEFGNVTCHIQEVKGVSEEKKTIPEDLDYIEPPDFLDSFEMPSLVDPSIPTPSELIDRIRSEVQQRLSNTIPSTPPYTSPLPRSPVFMAFPEDLPDEELFDIDIPEFEGTPQRESPQTRVFTPIEQDERLYAWGETLPQTPTSRSTTPKAQTPSSEPLQKCCPSPKPKTPEGQIVVPPHPKDPKDYTAMVKRAQAIQKRKKQLEAAAAILPPLGGNTLRAAIPAKYIKKEPRKRMMLIKRVPKVVPRKEPESDNVEERGCPSEPPPLPKNYAEHVARARLAHGLKNKTAALNPIVAAKLAAEEAAQAAYNALPEHEKIKIRMEKVRRTAQQNRRLDVSDGIPGTIAAIRASMQDLKAQSEQVTLDTSNLMIETPKNLQERFRRLKEAQERQKSPPKGADVFDVSSVSPTAEYSPIRLTSPKGAQCVASVSQAEESLPISLAAENEWLLDINDEAPQRQLPPVRQLRDLKDMPFDEIEFEDNPSFTNISMDIPMSPPPRPSDIITKVKSKVQQKLREEARRSHPRSPCLLEFPKELPEEELFELSAPSFACTPQRTPPARQTSPRISLPMVWDAVPSPPKMQTLLDPQVVEEVCPVAKFPSSAGQIVVPPHPKDPKNYAAIVRRAQAIYKRDKQKAADIAAAAPPTEPSKRKGRVPISRWQAPPSNKSSTRPRKKLLKKQLPFLEDDEERECPAKPPPFPQNYAEHVARARLLHGLENKTAALNPKIAAKLVAKKVAAEVAQSAYDALPEHEKIKVRMERLRKRPHRRRRVKPTMEQMAYVEALKQIAAFEHKSPARPPDLALIVDTLQQLETSPGINLRERYRQVAAQMQATPKSPVLTPVKTPEIRYSPIRLASSPLRSDAIKCAERSTTQVIKSANNTIKEQVIETSEIVNGKLEHVTTHVTTATDPNGNVTCQINESKNISTGDNSSDLEEDLDDIEEPSFLDNTPTTPSERPRPRDIIERIRKEVKKEIGKYRPEVPTGQLIELRTPPRPLPFPNDIPDKELLDISCPTFPKSPPRTPVRTPRERSPEGTPNISIPRMFVATSPLPPVSPLRHVPSPKGAIVVPPHPKDPTDYAAMVKRSRKMQQLRIQKEAEQLAAKEAKAVTTTAIADAETAWLNKKVPISRWTAPIPKKYGTRKKLVMRKRGDPASSKNLGKDKQLLPKEVTPNECADKPPALPEDYAEHVARARQLAGLRNRTAALNPKVAAREAAKAEAVRIALEDEAARLAPVKDYGDLLSKITYMRERGAVPRGQLSMAAAAYLNALKGEMQIGQQPVYCPTESGKISKPESPAARYRRIMEKRASAPTPVDVSPVRTPLHEDIPYTPIRFVSPQDANIDLEEVKDVEFNMADFEGFEELDELGEMEEPSFMDVSYSPQFEEQYMPPTPPQTPIRTIRRIQEQVQQQQATECPPSPPRTPLAFGFPEDITEEQLFELSLPTFARTPVRQDTPIRSPNISLPQYFEQTPPPRQLTPKDVALRSGSPRRSRSPAAGLESSSILLGVCPEVRAKTPEGRIVLPPHPKDLTDDAIIRRTQLIQKLRAIEAAEKAAKTHLPKISRRPDGIPSVKPGSQPKIYPPPPKKGKFFRRLLLKKKAVAPPSPRKCPAEPPKLPSAYLEAVANARRLAGLKNKTALLNPKVAYREAAKAASNEPKCSHQTAPPADYANIIERAAALRANTKIQEGPTLHQTTSKQNVINRQQGRVRKRLMRDLERIRQQQAIDDIPLDFGPMETPLSVQERLQILKSRMMSAAPTTSQMTYSPVKTPDLTDLPLYQPLVLPLTPPYQFLDNICIPDIGDVSMPSDIVDDNYEMVDAEQE